MRDIDELVPDVMALAPKAPEVVVTRHIIAAIQEFCERTRLWKVSDDTEIAPPDCACLCPIAEAVIMEVEWAELDGCELEPVTPAWLDEQVRGWARSTEVSNARYITQLTPNSLRVVPLAPAGTLFMRLALKPARGAAMVPSFVIDEYSEDIANGAAGRVLTSPGDWANPQLGAAHLAKFAERLDTLAVRAAKGKQKAPLRSVGSYF